MVHLSEQEIADKRRFLLDLSAIYCVDCPGGGSVKGCRALRYMWHGALSRVASHADYILSAARALRARVLFIVRMVVPAAVVAVRADLRLPLCVPSLSGVM